ncbi:hypothetical protein L5515_014961 [Caenorhabditis briggsae]|uniref:NADP-dependent oxidoreductase domain-containing protein n=3 Tax=Caenorhabditis briggsae TaxID=6238 RepID=A0AAE9EDN0_CAEBR|nr:hypothetical protein L5515_014961 [Caenorhabditis briggsae]
MHRPKLRTRSSKPEEPMRIAEKVLLSSGYEMPVIGYGTWQIPKSTAAEQVREALEFGYRHIDMAHGFNNTTEIFESIRDWMKVRKFQRDEIFLSAKIWNTHHSKAKATEQIDEMLQMLDTPYMDLIVIHWPYGWAEDDGMFPRGNDGKPIFSNIDYMETWEALEEAHQTGKVRSIGVANFNLSQLDRIYTKGTVKPSVLQAEINPYFTQKDVINYCKARNIMITAMMITGNPGSTFYRKYEDPNLLFDETLISIAKNHGKTVTQVLIRWILDLGLVALIKSNENKRIRQNFNVFKFKLTPEQIERIDSLNKNFRILWPILGNYNHPHFPWPYKADRS